MSPLTKMLTEVGVRIEELEAENAKLTHDVKKVTGQYLDMLDEVHARGDKIKALEEHISELQAMVSRAHEHAAQ